MIKVFLFLGLLILVNVLASVVNKKLGEEKVVRRFLVNLVRVFLTIVLMFMVIFAYFTRNNGIKHYDSFEKFKNDAPSEFVLPSGAEDVKMAINNRTIAKSFFISYVLDDEELEAFIEETVKEKYSKTNSDGEKEVVLDEYQGIKVSEIDGIKATYNLDDFPKNISFDTVIDDNIEDYIVIFYEPKLSFTSGNGIVYNKDTNRVVQYYYATLK